MWLLNPAKLPPMQRGALSWYATRCLAGPRLSQGSLLACEQSQGCSGRWLAVSVTLVGSEVPTGQAMFLLPPGSLLIRGGQVEAWRAAALVCKAGGARLIPCSPYLWRVGPSCPHWVDSSCNAGQMWVSSPEAAVPGPVPAVRTP